MGILQDDNDDDKVTSVPGTPITQMCLGFDDDEGSYTGTCTGGHVRGSTSAANDDGENLTPLVLRGCSIQNVLLIDRSSAGLVMCT